MNRNKEQKWPVYTRCAENMYQSENVAHCRTRGQTTGRCLLLLTWCVFQPCSCCWYWWIAGNRLFTPVRSLILTPHWSEREIVLKDAAKSLYRDLLDMTYCEAGLLLLWFHNDKVRCCIILSVANLARSHSLLPDLIRNIILLPKCNDLQSWCHNIVLYVFCRPLHCALQHMQWVARFAQMTHPIVFLPKMSHCVEIQYKQNYLSIYVIQDRSKVESLE